MTTGTKVAIYLMSTLVLSAMAIGLPATVYGLDVTLEWTAVTGDIDGYIICYDDNEVTPPDSYGGIGAVEGASEITVPFAELENEDPPQYTLHGLNNTNYFFSIRSYKNDAGEDQISEHADPVNIDDNASPSSPEGLAAERIGASVVKLTWQASTTFGIAGLEGYRIYRREGAEIEEMIADVLPAGTLEYDDDQPEPNHTYTYRISAYTENEDESLPSYPVTVDPYTDTQAPSVPANLAGSLDQDAFEAVLTWTASTDNVGVAGYEIHRDGSMIGNLTNLSTLRYVDGNIVHDNDYAYQVLAYDAAYNKGNLTTALTVEVRDTQAPTAPNTPTLNMVTTTQVVIAWTGATDNVVVTGYKVYRNGSELTPNSTTATYTDDDVTAGETNTYTVIAYDSAGNESAASDSLSVTVPLVPDNMPPTQPGKPNTIVINEVSSSVSLSWEASSDDSGSVARYNIYRNDNNIAVSNTNSYTDNAITAGQSYIYYITAVDIAGNESEPSDESDLVTINEDEPGTTPGTSGFTERTSGSGGCFIDASLL